jgi:uncharacterized membrane protein (UPF0127 family)
MGIPLNQWITITRGPYKIIVADSLDKRSQGLQGVTSLPENTLMLFPNINPGSYFHTINCFLSLDIVPISNSGEVLNIYTVKPNTKKVGPTPYLTSKILEAPAGWFHNKGIRIGDYVPLLNI